MASIQDVAKKAKVGVGTVSRVLSGNGYVAEDTKRRVEKAIKALDYTPNELARNLLRNKTNIIGVIVPDIANPFYASLVNEIEKELRKHGYKTMLCNTVGEQTNEKSYLEMLKRNMVDGIITGTHTLDFEAYQDIHCPIVSLDTPPLAQGIPVIMADHTLGGRMAAEALLRCGCKEVVQFRDKNIEQLGKFPYFKRHEEFSRVIKQNGAVCHDYIVEWNDFNLHNYQKVVEECMEEYPHIDGAFGTDSWILCFRKLALMRGKRIPEDIRLVAYDNTDIMNVVYPTVSVVEQPIGEIALTSVDLITRLIGGEQVEESVTLAVTFREGASTQIPEMERSSQ